MSNLQEMPQPQGADELKRIAQEHFDAIKTAAVLESSSSLKIGYHALRLKEANLWGILGYRDEMDAREAAGVSKSGWFAVIRLAESFRGLSEELFTSMLLANATALSDLPESKRLDREWIEYAATESIKNFAKRVDREMNGRARDSDSKERTVRLTIDLPASQKKIIDEKVQVFAEAHGMDGSNVGAVLEAVIVEATEGDTLTGAIVNAVQRLKRVKELCESGLSSDEILSQVIELNEASIVEFSNILLQVGKQYGEEAA